MDVKVTIKEPEYILKGSNTVVVNYINETCSEFKTKEIFRGMENIDIFPLDTVFKVVDSIPVEEGLKPYYVVYHPGIGMYIVREDNLKPVKDFEYIMKEYELKTIFRSKDKTVLINEAGEKYITTKLPEDKEDLEKAVMIVLLKECGYSVKDIYAMVEHIKTSAKRR